TRSPGQLLARGGGGEPKDGRVQGQPRGAALIRSGGAVEGAVVDPLAADRRGGFAEGGPHPVRPGRLPGALDQGEPAPGRDPPAVSDRALPGVAFLGAAAPAVAAVGDEPRLDAPVRRLAPDDGQVAALDAVGPELQAERALGLGGPGEDDQAAGILVQAV